MKLVVGIVLSAILSSTAMARERADAAELNQIRREVQSEYKKDKKEKEERAKSCDKEGESCHCSDKKKDNK